jgi:hypothetical protein
MMPTAAEEGMYMPRTRSLSRRQFIARTVAAAASGPLITTSASGQDRQAAPPALARKVKLGVVGLGGRGRWIAGLFRRQGGYDIHSVADYFPQVAQEQGTALGVDPARRFWTTDGSCIPGTSIAETSTSLTTIARVAEADPARGASTNCSRQSNLLSPVLGGRDSLPFPVATVMADS